MTLHYIGGGGSSWRDPRNWALSEGGGPLKRLHARGSDELVVSGFVKAAHGKTLDLRGMPHKELRIAGFVGLLILPDGRRINFSPAKKSRLRGAIRKLLPKLPSVSLPSVPRLPMPAMIGRAASAVYAPVWRRRQRYRKPLDPLVVPRWLRENIRTQDGWKDAVRLGTCALVVQGAALFVIPFLSGGASTWFWVGGTGTWDGATTTHWASASGGAGGAGVPVAGDTVNFDANSGTAATVTVAAAAANVAACTINKSDITLTASGALSQSSCAMTLTAGTLNTNGQTVSWLSFSSSNSNARTVTLGASTITVTAGAAWTVSTVTGLTISPNTATLNITGAAATFVGATNWNGLSIVATGSGTYTMGGETLANFTRTGTAQKSDAWSVTANLTVTGVCTLGGGSTQGVNRLMVQSSTVGTQRTVTAGSYVINGDVDFQDANLAYSGGASWTNTGSAFIGDCWGNAGAVTTNASVAAQQTWSGTSGGNWSTNAWTTRVPLPQDPALIASAFGAAQTITADMPRLGGDIDFTGSTGAPTFINGVLTQSFGSWTMATGLIFAAGANTHTLAGRGTHTIKSAGVSINGGGRAVTIEAVVGTYTHMDATSWGAGFNVNSGTWSSGNFTMQFNSFNSTSSRVRTVNAGTSTITVIAGGVTTPFFFSNTGGNFTLNATSSTFVISSPDNSTKTFSGGGFSFGTLRFVSTGTAPLTVVGSNTFVNLDLECTSARTITLDASGTNTVTGTLTLQGGSLTNLLSVVSSTPGTQTTIALGTTGVLGVGVCLSVKDVAVTGTNSPVVVGGSTNVSNNSGITFAKSAVAAGGNWSSTATWSDGVVPTAASPVFLVNGSGSVTVDTAAVCASFDCVTYTGTLTFSASNTLTASPPAGGAVRFAAGMTLTMSATNVLVVSLPVGGTVTLTSAGRTFSQFTVGGSTTGTLLVADSMTASNTVTLSAGGLNTNNQACTWGAFSSLTSSIRTLLFGSSSITITGGGASAWIISTAANLVIGTNTATVTFNGAGQSFSSGTINYQGLSVVFSGSGTATISGVITVGSLTRIGTAAKTDALSVSANFTVTGTFTATGNSVVNRLLVSSSAVGTLRTITATSWSLKNSDFMDIAGAGASSSFAPTLSGSEITDLSRIAAAGWGTGQVGGSTDGLSNGSGTGIWEAATNLFRRGQCDATTDWSVNSAAASVDATTPAPFSPQSIKTVTNGTVGNEGTAANSATGQAIAAGTSVVGSVYFRGVAGQTYEATMAVNNTDASTTIGAVLNFTATGAWQLVIPPALSVAVGKTGDSFRVRVLTHTIRAETLWYAHAMLQKGANGVSPYIATSGGSTASRNAGLIDAPPALLNTTQGWFAARLRMGFAFNASPNLTSGMRVMALSDGAGGTISGRLILIYRPNAGNVWSLFNADNTGSSEQAAIAGTFNAGDFVTVIGAWDAGHLSLSINGSAFTVLTGRTKGIPASTLFSIGNEHGAGQPIDSSMLWAACGAGTLTDSDAGTINGFGNFCPTVAALPGTATGVWNGATWMGTSMGDCQGNAGITFDASSQQTWSGTAGGNWSTNAWTTRVPLPQDDVVIASAFSASQTITADMPRLGRSITWTGSTGAPTFSPSTPVSLFGNLTFATGVLVASNANGVTFAGRGAQTITSNGVNLQGGGRSASFEAITGSYTLQDDAFWGCGVNHLSGTLDAGNHNFRCNNFLSASTRTRTLNMGSGTWTMVQTGTFASWSIQNTSTLTLNASTSTIAFTASDSGVTKTFQGGGLTYGTLQFKSTGNAGLVITGNNTFSALDLECTTARTITFDAGGTNTVRAILTLQGASGQLLSLVSSSPGTGTTITANTTLPTQGNIAFDSLSADVTLSLPIHRGAQFSIAAAAATQCTASAYVRGLAGGTARISLWDNVLGKQSGTDVALTSTGQRISVTAVTGTGATSFFVLVESNVGGLAFNVDGVQVQSGPVVTPFGVAGGARVRAPLVASGSTLLSATQGWVAARVKMGFAFNSVPHGAGLFPVVFCWADSAGNDIRLRYNQDGTGGFTQYAWSVVRESGGAGAVANAAQSAAQSFALGDTATVIAAWTATGLFISVNGGAFVAAPSGNTSIPALAATLLDIGSGGSVFAGREIGSTVQWFACGTGILSNADAAAIAAMSDIPNLAAIPAEAAAKGLWRCRTANMKVPGTGAGDALVAPVVYDTAGNLVGFGDTVTVPRGSAAKWYDLPFSADPGGLTVPASVEYDVGLIAGGVGSHVARFFSSKPGYSSTGGGRVWSDTFSDGPSNPFGTEWPTENDMTVYGDVFASYAAPTNELEFYYGRLPFREAQKVFSSTQPVNGTIVTAEASWHGTALDPERGSFVVVQAGGVFDQDDASSLIGQRVKITSLRSVGEPRTVYAFVHNALTIDAVSGVTPDLSLPRRLWMQLALPGDDSLTVTVQRMA